MPTKGDVVIRQATARQYTLEVYPDRPQVTAKDYKTALRLAQGFSGTTHVRIWVATAGGAFTEVEPSGQSSRVNPRPGGGGQ